MVHLQNKNKIDSDRRPINVQAWDNNVSVTIPEIQISPSKHMDTPTKVPANTIYDNMFHKYTRRFVDPALEHEYTKYLIGRHLLYQKIVFVCGAIMMLVSLYVDFAPPVPPNSRLFGTLDSLALTATILSFIACSMKRFQIYSQYIVWISLTFYSFMVQINTIWYGKDRQGSYATCVMLAITLICRLKFWYSMVTCTLIVAAHYVLSAINGHNLLPPLVFLGNPIGLIATFAVCCYPSYHFDTMLRRAFLNKVVMSLEERKLGELRDKVDTLLNNIFPPVLRQKLQDMKQKEKMSGAYERSVDLICDEHQDVTVLMADIVGFTALSSKILPTQLVEVLNMVFTSFDDIINELGMEKIRTIGDAYLCVSNMTYKQPNHQDLAVNAARRMISVLPQLNEQLSLDPPLALRIGLASGPVISGVTGLSKWNYDIFGQTVTDAFAMEAACAPLNITITESVMRSLKQNALLFTSKTEHQRTIIYSTGAINESLLSMKNVPSVAVRSKNVRFKEEPKEDTKEHKIASKIIANSKFYQTKDTSQRTRRYSKDNLNIKELTEMGVESRIIMESAQSELKTFGKKKRLILKFANSDLEKQYSDSVAASSQIYTIRVTAMSIIAFVLWIISDLMTSPIRPKNMPAAIWITYAAMIILAASFTMFSRSSWFFKSIAGPLNALYIIAIGTLLASQQIIDPYTIGHTKHSFVVTFICFQYIRMKQLLALSSGMIVVLVNMFMFILTPEAYTGSITDGDNLTHLIVYVVITTMSAFLNFSLEIGLRREFLANLILKMSMDEQEANNRQAKLLLYNILPRQIAFKLSSDNSNSLVSIFPNATMSFATLLIGDLAARPMEMFIVLNEIFTLFDKLVLDLECEKIKTINTTYMVVSGLPKERSDHTTSSIRLMQKMIATIKAYRCPYKDPRTGAPYHIGIRVGVASGPIVAGVIGKTKYSYDCWSDVTNTASRMESNGIDGYIQVTEAVYLLANHDFPKLYKREEVLEIKGKGSMETYLLKCDM